MEGRQSKEKKKYNKLVFPSGIKTSWRKKGFWGGDPDADSFSDALSLSASLAKQIHFFRKEEKKEESCLNVHVSHISGCAGEVCLVLYSLCL